MWGSTSHQDDDIRSMLLEKAGGYRGVRSVSALCSDGASGTRWLRELTLAAGDRDNIGPCLAKCRGYSMAQPAAGANDDDGLTR